ncbi:MAG: hypothetical protein JWO74_1603 [Solirubrobacterales bacterium]|nr:hypothetical protein [Solirubrobacterales bacterium]
MHARQELLVVGDGRDLARPVLVAELSQAVVGEQAVGVRDCAGGGRRLRERFQRDRARVAQDLQS